MRQRGLILLMAMVLGGCKLTYTITMKSEGDGFVRSIQRLELRQQEGPDGKNKTVKDDKFPASEAESLQKIYGAQAAGDPPTYRGVFGGKTPKDVGGAGVWVRWHAALGSTTVYVERFGGDIDLHQDFKEANRAVDQAADLLTDWFAHEMGKDPSWPKLKAFMDGPLRRDAKDLVVLLWLSRSTDDAEEEMTVRLGHQLIERGYTTVKRLPSDLAALQNNRGFELLRRVIVRRMGVDDDQPIPASLDFLSSAEKSNASFEAWYEKSDFRKKQLAEWERQKKTEPDLEKPTKPDIDMKPLLGRGFLAKPHHVVVTLQSPEKPYATNGKWHPAENQTRWHRRYDGQYRLPTLIYASWSEPNEATQKKIFGRVILKGQALGEYLLGLQGMSPPQRQRFEAYVQGLEPGDNLAKQIGEYQTAEGKQPPVVQILVEALGKEG